ncbi:MAG: hypothetical protein QNL33_02500 [Akkermansiaceae bacterium]|jgi:hypothetical protein
MNTTNILLGTISLLLVVAFAVSFGGFRNDKESDESQVLRQQLQAEITKAEAETEALRLKQLGASASYVAPPSIIPPVPVVPTPVSTEPSDAELLAKLETTMAEKEQLAAERDEFEKKLELSEKETDAANSEKNKIKEEEKRRATKVRMALLMGTVTNANKEYGSVIFQPTETANFQPGKILNVRRNDGIIGKIEVIRLDNNLYVCDMRPHGYSPDGFPDIQPGDEVIIDHGDE